MGSLWNLHRLSFGQAGQGLAQQPPVWRLQLWKIHPRSSKIYRGLPPPLTTVSLSTVSVTGGQPRSKNVKFPQSSTIDKFNYRYVKYPCGIIIFFYFTSVINMITFLFVTTSVWAKQQQLILFKAPSFQFIIPTVYATSFISLPIFSPLVHIWLLYPSN